MGKKCGYDEHMSNVIDWKKVSAVGEIKKKRVAAKSENYNHR